MEDPNIKSMVENLQNVSVELVAIIHAVNLRRQSDQDELPWLQNWLEPTCLYVVGLRVIIALHPECEFLVGETRPELHYRT